MKAESLLTIDVGHLFIDSGARGAVRPEEFEEMQLSRRALFDSYIDSLSRMASPLTLPLNRGDLPEIKALARRIREKYDHVLLLGIGGSALGAKTIGQFLKRPFPHLRSGKPRLFIIDNIDPMVASQIEELADMNRTALIYVSKSGSTPETAANFVYFYNRYTRSGGDSRDITVICDPAENGINRIARGLGCLLLHTPPALPGRYSVLSCAGLLPAEIMGIDGGRLLDGAWWAHQAITGTPYQENPLAVLGLALALLGDRGKTVHVLFAYSSLLAEFGLWFAQLWGESLGKRLSTGGDVVRRGTTPLACTGATDQHSLLQLFKEGPGDKVIGFLRVDNFPDDKLLPSEFATEKEYNYFSGHTMKEQLHIEQVATELSLFKAGNPCYRICLYDMSPETLGALFYFYQNLVALVGGVWQVNPFDQPGVEEGKRITYALMGREDYRERAGEYRNEVAHYESGRRLLRV